MGREVSDAEPTRLEGPGALQNKSGNIHPVDYSILVYELVKDFDHVSRGGVSKVSAGRRYVGRAWFPDEHNRQPFYLHEDLTLHLKDESTLELENVEIQTDDSIEFEFDR